MIRILAARELHSLFSLPSSWFMLGVLQFLLAWSYLARLDAWLQVQPQLALLANPPGVTAWVAAPMFDMVSLLLMVLIPLFTMRAFAEERRNQTLALLLSSPVSNTQLVLGKFCGLLAFLALIVCTSLLMVATLGVGTALDWGLLLANLLGLLLIVMSYAAFGIYVSALTSQPLVAAIGGLAGLLGLWMIDVTASDEHALWHILSPAFHFRKLNAGLLDSADLGFFLLFTATFLLLTIFRLQGNRQGGR
ncbi:MAG: ABC transporter permease subunit [Nitrosomonadales bacterium]|nr:ABC transporter permease subunit [Nitrosomonadales bacterium]